MAYMTKEAFLAYMEKEAPRALAESWDNVGMLIDCGRKEYKKVLAALELTEAVAAEAAQMGADLIVTHHPVMLGGIKRLDGSDAESRAIMALVRGGISLFAAHTNFDSARRGTNAYLAEGLALEGVLPLEAPGVSGLPEGVWGMGRIGDLPQPCTLETLAEQVRDFLKIPFVRLAGDPQKKIGRVALCTGSGSSMAEAALCAGADVLVTGDLRHHAAAEAAGKGLALIDAGHFETEAPAMKWLIDGLQAQFNRVEYNTEFCVSQAQAPVLYTV